MKTLKELFGRSDPTQVDEVDNIPEGERIAEFDWAIEHNRVTLDQLIDVRHMTAREHNPDEASRLTYARYGPRLLEAYVRDNGRIEDAYFCKEIRGAAILTERTGKGGDHVLRIHMRYPPASVVGVTPEFEEALWRCTALSKKATQLLRTQNSRMLHKLMHSLIVYLLSVLDTLANEPEEFRNNRIQMALDRANKELEDAESQYDGCARWGAQLAYSKGLLLGLLYLVLLGGGLMGVVWSLKDRMDFEALDHFLICLFGGGLGAIVSVMYRMTYGKLQPNHHTEHRALTLLASMRPLVGGVFASAIYVLIWGKFIPLSPPGAPETLYFVSGVAFLAGFSERFAQATLSQAQKSTAASASEVAQTQDSQSDRNTGQITSLPNPAIS